MTERKSRSCFLFRFIPAFILFSVSFFSPAQKFQWGRQSKDGYGVYVTSVGNDAIGNAYMSGNFGDSFGSFYGAGFGSYTLSTDNSGSAFYLVKYDPEGEVLWAKSSGQPSGVSLHAISSATDPSGITCVLSSSASGITLGSYVPLDSGAFLLVKYDSFGNVLWAKNSGQKRTGVYQKGLDAVSIATDISSNIYVTGHFDTTTTIGTNTLVPKESFGAQADFNNVFTAKYDPSGNVLWVKTGQGTAWGNDIAADISGNVVVTGQLNEALVTFDSYTVTNSRLNYNPYHGDIFIVKYDAYGNVLWAKGSDGGKYAPGMGGWLSSRSIAADVSGKVFITGNFTDSSLILGSDTVINNRIMNSSSATNGAFFIAKYDANGNVLWARGAGGDADAFGSNVITDQQKNVYVSGSWDYYFVPETLSFGTYTLTTPSDVIRNPMFIAKYDPDGNALCASALRSGGFISSNNPIAVGPLGSIYVAGSDFSLDNSNIPGDTLHIGSDTLYQDGGYFYAFIGRYQGCEKTDLTTTCNELNIPNVFSPNGDGKNDVFYFNTDCVKKLTFAVYNRWGQIVYETKETDTQWNGMIGQNEMDAGVYFYSLNATLKDGTDTEGKGNITLLR